MIATTVYVDHTSFDISSVPQMKADHTADKTVHEARSTQRDHGREEKEPYASI
jgi:hypothetical protein